MGSVYRRGDSPFLWVGFTDATGKRRLMSTGTADEAEAKEILLGIDARVRLERETGVKPGALTVRAYAAKWIEERRERRISSVDDDEARLKHALPTLGRLALKDVRPQHLRDLVRALEKAGELAPRSVLHVYGVLRVMFSDAVVEDLISGTPAVLKQRRGDLPKKRDKDPRWRPLAIFTHAEIEALISDVRIPERQRMLFALEFLCGVRVNEVTPRRWSDYEPQAEPLGRLTFATAWALKRKVEKEPKTGHAREVPVHPTLAKLLAQWKLSGWARVYGRAPQPADLIIPARPHHTRNRTPEMASRIHLNSTVELEGLHAALVLLGLRKRRQHDFRRTFTTLGQADGGRRDVLETITHDPKGDVTSLYTSFPWPTKCEAVAHLKIHLREGTLLPLAPTEAATRMLRSEKEPAMAEVTNGRGGNRTRLPSPSDTTSGNPSPQKDGEAALAASLLERQEASQRSDVATSDDYEERARAAGFTVLFTTEAG